MSPAALSQQLISVPVNLKDKARYEFIHKQYAQVQQEHVFALYPKLTPEQQSKFLDQLASIDPERVVRIHKATISRSPRESAVHPVPKKAYFDASSSESSESKEYWDAGLKAIASGKVALLLLAGGQGTRLGSSSPKGCYNIGLPSSKSLFQLQAERYRRIRQLANAGQVPWYIMVSGPTRKETEQFFQQHEYFGVDQSAIHFFEQGTLPAFDANGKIILEAMDRVALSPDGNGGIYKALESGGILADMRTRGIEYVHAYCVDNCLVKVLDPVFIGYNVKHGCDASAKTVPKLSADEAVGVVCVNAEGRFEVAEYSEIPKAVAEATSGGRLQLGSANIANHFFTRSFLEHVQRHEGELQFHVAHKKVPYVDQNGVEVKPTAPNAVKMELFIFDAFPLCAPDKFSVVEGKRASEFSPLKNKVGADSAETSRRDIMLLHLDYLQQAGGQCSGHSSSTNRQNSSRKRKSRV